MSSMDLQLLHGTHAARAGEICILFGSVTSLSPQLMKVKCTQLTVPGIVPGVLTQARSQNLTKSYLVDILSSVFIMSNLKLSTFT